MTGARKWWIDPSSAKNEVTLWENNPTTYQSFTCLSLPGGLWPARAIEVIELSAYTTAVNALKKLAEHYSEYTHPQSTAGIAYNTLKELGEE